MDLPRSMTYTEASLSAMAWRKHMEMNLRVDYLRKRRDINPFFAVPDWEEYRIKYNTKVIYKSALNNSYLVWSYEWNMFSNQRPIVWYRSNHRSNHNAKNLVRIQSWGWQWPILPMYITRSSGARHRNQSIAALISYRQAMSKVEGAWTFKSESLVEIL